MTRTCMERNIGLQNVSTKPHPPLPPRARPPIQRRHPSLPRLTIFVALILVAASTSVNCSGGGSSPPSPSPAPSLTAAPTFTPVDVSADLARAAALMYEGDFEAAIRIYGSAARATTGAQRLDALSDLARAAYRGGDKIAAEQALADLLASRPDAERTRQALLLLGAVRLDRGDDAGAREALVRYVNTNGPAASYALARLAEIADRMGDGSEAIRYAAAALTAGLPPQAAAHTRFNLASFLEDAGDIDGALAEYRQAIDTAPDASTRAEADWRLAGAAYRAGQAALSAQTLRTLVHEYPWHARALEALEQPQLTAGPPPVRDRALVLFRHRVNADAEAAFRQVLNDPAGYAAEAHYYLGILAERAGDPEAALAEYDASVALLSGGGDTTLLGQALWDRATVVETLGTPDEAAAAYTAVADRAPGSERAPEALFRAGLILYRGGLPGAATPLWERYLGSVTGTGERARALFWLAEAAAASGDPGGAERDLASAASIAPTGYYGMRAHASLGGSAFPPPSALEPAANDWEPAEAWLAGWLGPEDIPARDAFFGDGSWLRAVELKRAGLEFEAGAEFDALIEKSAAFPWLLYRFARAASDQGAVSAASRAAQRLSAQRPEAPPELLRLVYPLEYLDLANEYALDNGFSPLLLLALVRQESLYEPGAASYAGATGLTQVIPATAADIAAALGEKDFEYSDLLRPRVSLRFGAYYLGQQLAGFGGNTAAALAAYNGGPGSAGRWLDDSGPDADLFLESITFPETRAYVELVLENYALYLYAYGLVPEPSLPLP